MTFVLARDLT